MQPLLPRLIPSRMAEAACFMVPVLGSTEIVPVPLPLQTYRALALPGAIGVDDLFRWMYPRGLRRLPIERIGKVWGVSTTRWWMAVLADQHGAIAFTLGSAGYGSAGVTTCTVAATLPAGTDATFGAGASDRSGSATVLNTLTYDGGTLTLNAAVTGPNTETMRSGYRVAPTTGLSRNYVATFSSPNTHMGIGHASFSGVDQTTPIDTGTVANVTGTGNGIAAWTISVATGNVAIGFCAHLVGGITVTPGTGVTLRANTGDPGIGNWGRLVVGTRPDNGTFGWTTNGNPPSFGQAFEINASGAVAAAPYTTTPGQHSVYAPGTQPGTVAPKRFG